MALGKELFFFCEKSLPRASPKALSKEFYFFLKKSLCRGPPTMALGKEMFQNFSNESLPRVMEQPSGPLPRALVIALGKEA